MTRGIAKKSEVSGTGACEERDSDARNFTSKNSVATHVVFCEILKEMLFAEMNKEITLQKGGTLTDIKKGMHELTGSTLQNGVRMAVAALAPNLFPSPSSEEVSLFIIELADAAQSQDYQHELSSVHVMYSQKVRALGVEPISPVGNLVAESMIRGFALGKSKDILTHLRAKGSPTTQAIAEAILTREEDS